MGVAWPRLHLPLFPQLCASRRARTGAPAAGPSSACAALASVEPAVRKSSLRRNLTPRTPGQHPDAQRRVHPTCVGAAQPEKALQPEHSHWHRSCHRPGKSPSLSGGASSSGLFGEDLMQKARVVLPSTLPLLSPFPAPARDVKSRRAGVGVGPGFARQGWTGEVGGGM